MPRWIPPQVSLRAFREWRGLTLDQLADGIRAHGIDISTNHINNVELGYKQTTAVVMDAWARVLGINPGLIRCDREVRQYLGAVDEDRRTVLEPAA
ncbi:helix-turn-helix domain-containing protein [Micromonospora carbonacea]|uniref:Helix-turn-helix n=1 Tax=Micromonospora carbonacea TaxID=47853 RepID=A0A1C5AD74_9ACTN|nr:helix-turn-helix transcriptional regulator [Micromonospora carbonacea]SCF43202.1 Helix-turn-helix [Micromonospora carbonacea]